MTPGEYNCRKCGRLAEYLDAIRPKKSHAGKPYWNRPVLPFGDPAAWLLVVGLAPGAHGANRTSLPFHGDIAGNLLYGGLFDAGLCNRESVSDFDPELELAGVLVTNAVRCCPPGNSPTAEEFGKCRPYLAETLSMPTLTDILCVGLKAYEQVAKVLGAGRAEPFRHGLRTAMGRFRVHCSYHTSGYNQSTKRITRESFVAVLDGILAARGLERRSVPPLAE